MAARFRVLVAAAVLGAATLTASPASAAVTVTVDALTVGNSAPVAARPMTATAKVRASGTLAVQALTIAVRDSAGQVVDFPGAIATTLTTATKTFTTDARAYPAGTYTYFVAYEVGNVWTELTPRKTFTVAANPITFDQDFSGAAGGGPNTGLAAPVWFNDPCWHQACTGSIAEYKLDHAQLDGQGHLVLTADQNVTPGAMCGWQPGTDHGEEPDLPCRYATARLTMLDWEGNDGLPTWTQAGGHLEARMKAPLGKGLWPAFWTVGGNNAQVDWPASGEIDVMETLGDHPALVEQHAHGGLEDINFGDSTPLPEGEGIDDWHTYAVDWDAGANGYIKWSIDGVVTRTLTAAAAGAAWAQSFRHPHTLILNLAVGGGDGWVGDPDADTVFPARLVVDQVRAYQKPLA
ncbi:glycoside hydrolase family 16 protein [Nonomuraea sp. NPDC049141]|uniref:glycoside hydrolase family 16 protein n=1 Tax=Nonomuraea sp. NPDC049141 TaxID=3155500 RepID=UPI0033F49D93